MPFSHHSHSGQYCAHAKGSLSDMVAAAVSKNMIVFGMTEHMPRGKDDLYPEEVESGFDAKKLAEDFESYVKEAERLRQEHANNSSGLVGRGTPTELLLGFEAEWIRPAESTAMVHRLIQMHRFDYFIGSVHHVHTIPIDFDRKLYEKARNACGGSEEQLFNDYYDAQYWMLQALNPKVVGHLDLIRLLSDEPDRDWRSYGNGEIWSKITRNLCYIVEYGGLLEINTAAWRKKLEEPYPRSEICASFIEMGGSFVLSADSHAVDQVATNYSKLPAFLQKIGLREVCYLGYDVDSSVTTKSITIDQFLQHPFWSEELYGYELHK